MKRGGWIIASLVGTIVLLLTGAWMADGRLRAKGHPGLKRFAQQLWVNYPKSFQADPPVLEIKVDEQALKQLEQVVADARARGVIIPEGNEYVPAEVKGPEGTFKAKIRIKGKLTDHVQGEKWSFRVIAKKDGGSMGMRRFSLQHPGTRNYLNDWFYHRLMEGEGIIALRYGFIRLVFNEEDLGIYAYEEHFGQELLQNNQRSPGPIFRFDPGLYWEHRLNEMHKLKVDGPYAEYQAAAIDAFDTKEIGRDPEMLRQFAEVVGAMDSFRRGRIAASQVFDADKIARRHAILDLIGGHHSMDFSDVKFYYDPVARKVEPVAYESFSAFPIRTLAGSHRFTGQRDEKQDLHDAYFNDPELFRAYVEHLERVSNKAYLDSVFAVLGPAIDTASAIIYSEFPWKELDRKIFYDNQRVIRRLLDVPKGFHAYMGPRSGDTLELLVIPIEALPMEVHGLSVNGEFIPPVGQAIVPCRAKARMGVPYTVRFAHPALSAEKISDPIITYGVLGASVRKELEVFPYPLYDPVATDPAFFDPARPRYPAGVQVEGRDILFPSGAHVIEGDLVIPAGARVLFNAPLTLDLRNGARLISHSPFNMQGTVDLPIRITSSDSSGAAIILLETGGPSELEHVRIDLQGASRTNDAVLTTQQGRLRLRGCIVGGDPSRDLIRSIRSDLRMHDCTLAGGRDQVNITYSYAELRNIDSYGAKDDAIVTRGGMSTLKGIRIEGAGGTGVKAAANAEMTVNDLDLLRVRRGLELEEGATVQWTNGSIDAVEEPVTIRKVNMRHGRSRAMLERVRIQRLEAVQVKEGNELILDGTPANADVRAAK